MCCTLSLGPSYKCTQLLCFEMCSRLDSTKMKGLEACERGGYPQPPALLHRALPLLCPHAHCWLWRDGPACSALLGKRTAGDFCKALLIWRDSRLGWRTALGPSCILHQGREDASRSVHALASNGHSRGACCSSSFHVPWHGETHSGIPELSGSLSAPEFMLFHNIFWERIAGF